MEHRALQDFGRQYKVNTGYGGKLQAGDYMLTIKSVSLARTKNGHPMAKIIMSVQGTGSTLIYYLTDNRSNEKNIEWSNKRLTKFFDCFCIERGNFKTNSWVGHSGMAHIGKTEEREDGRSWYEIKYLIVTEKDSFFHDDEEPADISATCQWDNVIDFEKEQRGIKSSNIY